MVLGSIYPYTQIPVYQLVVTWVLYRHLVLWRNKNTGKYNFRDIIKYNTKDLLAAIEIV